MPGIYIHIPFCVKKCRYCDFISFDNRCEYTGAYIDALISEMREYKGVCADTVFIGGGTPTCIGAQQFERVLTAVSDCFEISENVEFTIEANPKTLNPEKLALMKKSGVNRISIGVQSFNDAELLKIGRIHNAETALGTIERIKKAGFDNFNIDLMSALPGQTPESFKKTLKTAVESNPAHISCYSLILEENTPLWREYEESGLDIPDEDTEREMYEYACRYLEKNGYRRYEISNFAKPGMESRHNIKYWKCEEYIGLGLAAHSYFGGARFSNTSDLAAYLAGNRKIGETEMLTRRDMIEEFMMMGLRMRDGVSRLEFKRRFGVDMDSVYHAELDKFLKNGYLKEKGENIYLSDEGVSVSNSIMCEFALLN